MIGFDEIAPDPLLLPREVPPEYAYTGWQPPEKPERQPSTRTTLGRLGTKSRRQYVLEHPDQILRTYFNFDPMPFHAELLRAMLKGGRIVAMLPTDHGKSIIGTFFFPILSLMNDPDSSHIICGANLNDAKRRVQAIQRELETNEKLVRDFPWLAAPDDQKGKSWSAMELTVSGRTVNKPNPSVRAAAVGSNDIRGRRGKLIMDDVEGPDHRDSALKRRQLYDFVKLEGIRCYEAPNETDRPLLIALGTPFDIDSIYFKLRSEGWEEIRYPCYKDEEAHKAEDKYLWPQQQGKVEDQRKHMNRMQFSIAYRLDPRGGDPSRLSFEELLALTQESQFNVQQDVTRTFVSLDGASGSAHRLADYAGIAVTRIHWEQGQELPLVESLELHKVPQGLFEQVNMAAELAHKYSENGTPIPVMYDSNANQGQIYADTFRHLHPEIRLVRHYTRAGEKFDNKLGLTVIKTIMRAKRFHVPQSQLESEGVDAFLREVRDLGDPAAHDHICSAVWFVIRWAYEQARFFTGSLVNGYSPQFGRMGIIPTRSFGGKQLWHTVETRL